MPGPFGGEARERGLDRGHRDQAGGVEARIVEQLRDLAGQLALAADRQNGERLAGGERRHAAEVRPEQGGQVHRHADVRDISTWITSTRSHANVEFAWRQ